MAGGGAAPGGHDGDMKLRNPIPIALIAVVTTTGAASAQTLSDGALESLYQANRSAELQRAAQQRLAAAPEDAQAVLALALVALDRNDAALRRDALERARACAERQPRSQPCHFAHGTLLGVQAMSEGMFAAARSIGTVREALTTAHALEPAWYPGRSALLEFHALAPGMMGGSTAKAAELAAAAPRPEQAAALKARLLLGDKKAAEALALLQPLLPVAEPALRADVVQWGTQAGLGLVNDGQAAKAQAWFEQLVRAHADESAGPYGLARVKGELGDWAAVPPLLQAAARLKGAERWPLDYRLGIAQQQLGQTEAARASLQRFIDAGRGQKNSLEDAKKRLAALAPR